MGNAAFLLAAVGLSIVGSILLWLRSRQPKSSMSSVDDFQREMRALGREPGAGPSRRRRSARTTESGKGPDEPGPSPEGGTDELPGSSRSAGRS